VDRGLLITRLWYIRYVDPMQLLLTGMTRDGLFLIENGEVTRGVKNMRFNESPIVMLSNIQALGRPKRSGNWMDIEAPGLVADNFTFTSGTSF
jgi:predicted Zn-dependent protease